MVTPLPDEKLVSNLIARQFPDFAGHSIVRLEPGGWDNVSFRLGETMLVKLPRHQIYASQPERECEALRALECALPLAIPCAIALGTPSEAYSHHWSILEWIEGETVAHTAEKSPTLPGDLAKFLRALYNPAPADAPDPGLANFWRGGPLTRLDSEFKTAVSELTRKMRMESALDVWEATITQQQPERRCWVHGDIAPANLLQNHGLLCAVIDFGLVSAGDPACDLAIAWLAFESTQREEFLQAYGSCDRDLLQRAQAWALWKAVLVLAGRSHQPPGYRPARAVIDAICGESRIV